MQFKGREYGVRGAQTSAKRRRNRARPSTKTPPLYTVLVQAEGVQHAPGGGQSTEPFVFEAPTLAVISKSVQAWIAIYGIGSTSYYEGNSGFVADDRGRIVARVSYNGRVWRVDPKTMRETRKEITGAELERPLRRRKNPSRQTKGIADIANWDAVQYGTAPMDAKFYAAHDQYNFYLVEEHPSGEYRLEISDHSTVPWRHVSTQHYPTLEAATRAAADFVRGKGRRKNPGLAILNPLPEHFQRFADDYGLDTTEREELNRALAKYCEFHGVEPEDITITQVDEAVVPAPLRHSDRRHFLVGMGQTEDVSYSANHKAEFLKSNKRGTPFRHETTSKPTMATDAEGQAVFILNRPDVPARKRMKVNDWMYD